MEDHFCEEVDDVEECVERGFAKTLVFLTLDKSELSEISLTISLSILSSLALEDNSNFAPKIPTTDFGRCLRGGGFDCRGYDDRVVSVNEVLSSSLPALNTLMGDFITSPKTEALNLTPCN